MREHAVKTCYDCPMQQEWEYAVDVCKADAEHRPCEYEDQPPTWCPLRQGPITIRLETQ